LARPAKWQAVVKPVDTAATVTSTGPVTLSTAQVGDEEIFYAQSTGLEASGDYSVTITHNVFNVSAVIHLMKFCKKRTGRTNSSEICVCVRVVGSPALRPPHLHPDRHG